MKLSDYLRINGISAAEFGKLIGLDPTKNRMTMHRYLNGRVPRPGMMQRIHTATGGEVAANDFVHSETSKAA